MHTQIHVTDNGLVVERRERFDGLVDTCKALHNSGLHGDKNMPLYAHVPAVFIEDYLNRTGITFAEFMAEQSHIKRFLNDPALAYFRVSTKRV
ncbi:MULTISPECIES: hypothetical protein [Mycetohabitans]|uniref:hypothetical protein n=1 Tax=Mycetohabitans TaxID=2571159 RepID=UPI001F3B4F00|nr:hypothetical protein [Mycetohabitans sp. B3]MCF2133874.1 hypothetical protein [Mycetohabitans sp. B3]